VYENPVKEIEHEIEHRRDVPETDSLKGPVVTTVLIEDDVLKKKILNGI